MVLHYFKDNLDSIFLECIFSGFGVCSKMDQFKMYEELYFSLNFNELRYTEEETGCLHPCSFSEYQIADKQVHKTKEGSGLYIAYGTLAVTIKREVQPSVNMFQQDMNKILSRFMITHLSQWYPTLEDLLVFSLASPSLAFGTSSNTGLLLVVTSLLDSFSMWKIICWANPNVVSRHWLSIHKWYIMKNSHNLDIIQ